MIQHVKHPMKKAAPDSLVRRNKASNTFSSIFITGERIQQLCDVYCGLPEDFQYNPRIAKQISKCKDLGLITSIWDNPRLIYCYSHRLDNFRKVLPLLKNKCILVSHNSDENITHAYVDIADHPRIEFWYTQNLLMKHSKVDFLPIGIANSMWTHGNLSIVEAARAKNIVKTQDFYFNFSLGTNLSERTACKTILENQGLIFDSTMLEFGTYLDKLSSYKYAICPPGNGVDCHRLWECLYMNVIPIALRSVLTEKVADLYPCILLDAWEQFDAADLLASYTVPNFEAPNINTLPIAYSETHSKGGGRLGNQVIRNIAVSLLAKQHNLCVNYDHNSDIEKLGIALYSGLKRYTSVTTVTDDTYLSILMQPTLHSNLDPSASFLQTKEIIDKIVEYLRANKQSIINANPFKSRYQNNNDLFIHIRLTDAVTFNPGLKYYLNSIAKLSFDSMYIATDEPDHRMIQNIRSRYPLASIVNNNELETIQFGSTCKTVLLSHGTYSSLIGYLAFFSSIYYPAYDVESKHWHGDVFSIDGWNKITM